MSTTVVVIRYSLFVNISSYSQIMWYSTVDVPVDGYVPKDGQQPRQSAK